MLAAAAVAYTARPGTKSGSSRRLGAAHRPAAALGSGEGTHCGPSGRVQSRLARIAIPACANWRIARSSTAASPRRTPSTSATKPRSRRARMQRAVRRVHLRAPEGGPPRRISGSGGLGRGGHGGHRHSALARAPGRTMVSSGRDARASVTRARESRKRSARCAGDTAGIDQRQHNGRCQEPRLADRRGSTRADQSEQRAQALYEAYYQPIQYGWEEVEESIRPPAGAVSTRR